MKKHSLLFLFLIVSFTGYSQFFRENSSVKKYNGYFNFYYDESQDKIFLEVDKLDTEFLYVHALSEGVGSNDIGLDRGQLGGGKVVKFKKAGNKLLLIQPNQKFRAITDNQEEKESIKEAFAKSVLFGFTIKEEKKGKYLIDFTNFLMQDKHNVTGRLSSMNQGSYRVDKTRSAINLDRTKAFPKNVEFDVLMTFVGKAKGEAIMSVTPDVSAVTVHQHHSFVELPDDNYKPRVYDPRCGSWQMSYMDYATPVDKPITKRFIYRHRLEKKNPRAKISEAKEPIIYYLDRGTPEPVRTALLEGGRWWNQAFESAGYKNAFQVKMLPADADPLDVRYNMIQWVHRSTRGWSYGSNISDPRTGEIIKGHVSLGSLRIRQDFLIAQALQAPYKYNDNDDKFALKMAVARIRQLSAHEIGHTLGFSHNYISSAYNRSSVMDYPHPLLRLKNGKIDFSKAYDTKIGDWDKVTVAYAYQDFPKNKNEEKELQKILADSYKKGLRYITDQDARPSGSAHYKAHLWDNGNDITADLDNVLKIRKHAISNFSTDNIRSKQPYSVLEDVFVPLYFFHRYQTEAVTKVIGGLDYNYATKGSNELIVDRIDGKTERKALNSLLKTINIDEIAIPKRLLKLFPPRAYGYPRTRESFKSRTGVAFDPYGAVQTASQFMLGYLLNSQRANRMMQHKNIDASQLGLGEVLDELIKVSFDKKYKDGYKQGLQEVVKSEVLNALFVLASSGNLYPQTQAIISDKIYKISIKLMTMKTMDKQYLQMIADFKKNPSKYKKVQAPKIPDGSPIGTTYKCH